jgi:outer membrane receptor protein involved in Fe transport
MFRKYFNEGNGRGLMPTGYIMSEENRWISENNTFWADYTTKLAGGQLTVDMSYQMWQLAPETMFYKEPGPNPFTQYMTGRDRMLRTLATFVRQSENVDIIVGAQFDNISSIPSYANDQLFGGNPLKFEGAVADSIEKALTVTERRGGVFAQVTYRFDSTLSVIAGGRFDFSRLFDDTFNPRLALISKILPETSIKLIYSTAFQAPSLFYQYEQFGTPNVVMTPAIEQESGLLNQHVTTYEIEITHRLASALLTANLFYTDGENLIERERYADSMYNKYFDSYTPAIRNKNIGSQEILGGYIHAIFHFSPFINGYAHYSYTRALRKVSAIAPEIATPRIAEHKFAAGISVQNIFGALTISPSMRWIGAQNNTLSLASSNPTIPGYVMVNIHAISNVIADRIQLFVSVENLLDSRIEQVGILGGAPYQDKVLQPGFVWNAGLQFYL